MATMTIVADNGNAYELDRLAIQELQRAKTANDANGIFDRLAPHVPPIDRSDIWFAIDHVTL